MTLFDIEKYTKKLELYVLSADLPDSTSYVYYSEKIYDLYLELLELVEGKDIDFWYVDNRPDLKAPPLFDYIYSSVHINGEIKLDVHYKNNTVLSARIFDCPQDIIKFLS